MIVQHLIEAGANVMARDDELDTPLHLALKDSGASQFLVGVLELCSGYSSAVPIRIALQIAHPVIQIMPKSNNMKIATILQANRLS